MSSKTNEKAFLKKEEEKNPLTSQCFQVVPAERCRLQKDRLDSVIQESFQAICGDINSNTSKTSSIATIHINSVRFSTLMKKRMEVTILFKEIHI